MTREEWIDDMERRKDTDEVVFRITRGCDRCGYFLPNDAGIYECLDPKIEGACRREHSLWLREEMDY